MLFDVDINGISILNVIDGRDGFVRLDPFTIKAIKKVLKGVLSYEEELEIT